MTTRPMLESWDIVQSLPSPIVAAEDAAMEGVSQLLVVSAPDWSENRITVAAYRLTDGSWVQELGLFPGFSGPLGFTDDPSELDWFTPTGSYAITVMFGHREDPGTKFPYRHLAGATDYWWVDDPESPLYNTWQEGEPTGRWESAEWLELYPHAFAFDFNQNPVIPHRNSAIFFHEGGGPTAGCIAISRKDLIEVMCWLDPECLPRIVLGVNASTP